MFPIDSPSYKPREELRFVAVTMLLLNLRSRPFLLTTIGPDAADEYAHPFLYRSFASACWLWHDFIDKGTGVRFGWAVIFFFPIYLWLYDAIFYEARSQKAETIAL